MNAEQDDTSKNAEKTYEVVYVRRGANDHPTDEFPQVEVIDFWLEKATPRREVWRYVVEEREALRLELGLDAADSVVRYQVVV